jgi:hypothetical protein
MSDTPSHAGLATTAKAPIAVNISHALRVLVEKPLAQ